MSRRYSSTKNLTPPAPLLLGLCPSRFPPIRAYPTTSRVSFPQRLDSRNISVALTHLFGYLQSFAVFCGKSTHVSRSFCQLRIRIARYLHFVYRYLRRFEFFPFSTDFPSRLRFSLCWLRVPSPSPFPFRRSGNGTLSRKERAVTGETTKASNERARRPPAI